MKRNKKLIYFMILLLITLPITYVIFKYSMLETIREFNRSAVKEDSEIVLTAFSRRVEVLENMVADWAQWDDSYQFVQDLNPEYETTNLIDETLEAANLNMILFFDTSGYVVYRKAVSQEAVGDTTIPAEIFSYASSNDKINVKELIAKNESMSGILHTTQGTFLFAVSPITKSDGGGTPKGAILFARYVNDADVAELEQSTGRKIVLIEPDEISRYTKNASIEELEKGPVAIEEKDGKNFSSYILSKDSWGTPTKVLRVSREIAGVDNGLRLVLLLTTVSGAISSAFSYSTYKLFYRKDIS